MGNKCNLLYRHLGNSMPFLTPLIITSGILTIISYFWGLDNKGYEGLNSVIISIAKAGIAFMIPVISGFIAYSISDKAGLIPGLLGGAFCYVIGAGFWGGIISGLLCGYTALLIIKYLYMPKRLEFFKFMVFAPVVTTLFIGLIMVYIIDPAVKGIYDFMQVWLTNIGCYNMTLFGAVIGIFTAFDVGGVLSRSAIDVSNTFLGNSFGVPQACIFAVNMTIPLGIALAVSISRHKYAKEERELGNMCWLFGIFGFIEGVIPFMVSDPIKIIPAAMIGSAVSGALTALFGCTVAISSGGLLALTVPGAIVGVLGLLLSTVIGAGVMAVLLKFLK